MTLSSEMAESCIGQAAVYIPQTSESSDQVNHEGSGVPGPPPTGGNNILRQHIEVCIPTETSVRLRSTASSLPATFGQGVARILRHPAAGPGVQLIPLLATASSTWDPQKPTQRLNFHQGLARVACLSDCAPVSVHVTPHCSSAHRSRAPEKTSPFMHIHAYQAWEIFPTSILVMEND
jgi:hypothetical protein